MREFGSDFHKCDFDFRAEPNYFDVFGDVRFYACGRHAIDAIILHEGFKRIWMPAYFCYEVIDYIAKTGIEVLSYDDNPLRNDDDDVVASLPFREGDVLLRMNYFGLRSKRSNKNISIPVIEDHTHGLYTQWAICSDADYCVASVRKTLPVASGGVLWSPKHLSLPENIQPTDICQDMAKIRYEAMALKAEYLKNNRCNKVSSIDGSLKDEFLQKFLISEEMIGSLNLSGMDLTTKGIISSFNVRQWTELKTDNWYNAYNQLRRNFNILRPKEDVCWRPYSLIFYFDSVEKRNNFRDYLIRNCIYPAILWPISNDVKYKNALDFSKRMLSIHCDMRYSTQAIDEMCQIINRYND